LAAVDQRITAKLLGIYLFKRTQRHKSV